VGKIKKVRYSFNAPCPKDPDEKTQKTSIFVEEGTWLEFWQMGIFSTRRTARHLELSYREFLELLAARKIPVFGGEFDLKAVEEAERMLAKHPPGERTGILDSNVTVGLAMVQVFDRLSDLYECLYIVPAVKTEVITWGRGRAGGPELEQALGKWVIETVPDSKDVEGLWMLSINLSTADQQVLAAALAHGVIHVLSDDRPLRQEASRRGYICLGAVEVVVLLKRRGLIPEARPVLDRLRKGGYGIAEGVYWNAVKAAGEWPAPWWSHWLRRRGASAG
jgi:predicted nucleic acid-binding protein